MTPHRRGFLKALAAGGATTAAATVTAVGDPAEAEALLQSDRCDEFLRSMYGNKPDRWDDDLQGWDRARVIVNAMTRLPGSCATT